MSYLLDTCVLSEFTRKQPHAKVVAWLEAQNEADLFLSAVVIGELAKGVAMLPDSAKKRRLNAWLYTDLCDRFQGRILPAGDAVALAWGEATGRQAREGLQIGMADGIIGATAVTHSLVAVTRNTHDISRTGAAVFNPWTD